jgi:methylenetetrahydrofolate reductase (NADPH)
MSVIGHVVSRDPAADLYQALRGVSYEVLPLRGTEERVVAHVPRAVPVTVTVTERKGLDPTLDLAERLVSHGYNAAPHLAARLIRDRWHLYDVVARLRSSGVSSVFVIAGDAAEPVGSFRDAPTLLEAMHADGHHFTQVGIGGYPEGHAQIPNELLELSLQRKVAHATHVTTQLCFNPSTTTKWAQRILASGVTLPIQVGLPGAVTRQRLLRITANIGLGPSARFLKKQSSAMWRFFLPRGYEPDQLIRRLAPALRQPSLNIDGFHLFTFNEIERTEAWRQDLLGRLARVTHHVSEQGLPTSRRPAEDRRFEDQRVEAASGSA